jgi:branched-chain amino acid transport system substrate-binding protein
MSARLLKSTLVVVVLLGFLARVVATADGVTDAEIKLGMCNALSGNSAELGTGVKAGASAFFARVNVAGGINGRKIDLISYDDAYEPRQTVAQTATLIESDKVFALFGYVGTPTSFAILPQLAKSGIPFIAPYTGAETLRNPVKRNVFNVRASYFDETEGLVAHLTTDLDIKTIGVFVQDDAYGVAGEEGVMKALRKRGLSIVGKGCYTRNRVDVDAAVAKLTLAKPEAVIMIGSYKACAAFIKKVKAGGYNPVFCNVSFVGTVALIRESGAAGNGVFISQVMPSPWDPGLPVVKDYQAAMKAAGHAHFDYTSLEGYVSAAIFAEAAKKAGKDLTREGLASALESLNTDIGGLTAAFSQTNHQAFNTVYFTRIQDGKAVPVTTFIDHPTSAALPEIRVTNAN